MNARHYYQTSVLPLDVVLAVKAQGGSITYGYQGQRKITLPGQATPEVFALAGEWAELVITPVYPVTYRTASEEERVVIMTRPEVRRAIARGRALAYVAALCPQPPADDHEHCPNHGCVEYVCCVPKAV
jgi:hypothetical protein